MTLGPILRIDLAKQPTLDKPPGLDANPIDPSSLRSNAGDGGPRAPESATPFVMSTPHHSTAWSQSYPEAYEQTVSQMEATLRKYEQQLQEAQTEAREGRLTDEQMQQAEAFYQEYQRLAEEYRQLTQEQAR